MSFEYIIEPEQKKKTLDDIAAEDLAKRIATEFVTYNDARQSNLDKADALSDEIFFRNVELTAKDKSKEEVWKSKVKMCKLFMFYQTFKAFIWKNIYANINSMFDVSGENQETDNNSNKQKSNLCYVFDKMKIQQTFDKIIDYTLIYGELISFSAWKKKYQEYRRPIDFFSTLYKEDITKLPLITKAASQGKNYYVDQKKIYDNPYVYAVNPADLVFDVTQKDNWDDCPKIYKSYKTASEILNNKLYKISPDLKDAINGLAKDSTQDILARQTDKDLKDEVTNGATIEVLEHWGNLKLEDGTVLKNWHAVVVGRKYLVQFEKNERIVNPFTYGALCVDPKTKRGISFLYSILDLAKIQEDWFNRTCDMQALTENPPIFAPQGFFDDDEVKLYPGKIIEYGDNLDPARIKPMEFAVNVFSADISYMSDLMAEISGIFPNMVGADENKAKTATEISTKAQGQVTRLAMVIDTINQYLIIPVVENVAKLLADFKFGEEEIYINKDNKQETIVINDDIRQGEYKYTYADRSMTVERMQNADKTAQILLQFKKAGLPTNDMEAAIWYLEQQGIENPERFFNEGVQLPQEIQNQLAQMPEIQAMVAGFEQRKQEMEKGQQPQQDLLTME